MNSELERYKSGELTLRRIMRDLNETGLHERQIYHLTYNTARRVAKYEVERGNVDIAYMLLRKMTGGPGMESITNFYKDLFSYNNEEIIEREILNSDDKNNILYLLERAVGYNKTDIVIKVLDKLEYDLKELVTLIFNSGYYKRFFPVVNKIADHIGLDVMKEKYGGNSHFNEWYEDIILNQV